MHLYLIRHGESEGPEKPDVERELTPKGIADVQKIARHVTSLPPKPKKIFVSPLKRARQTAEFFQNGWDVPLETKEWLLPSANPSEALNALYAFGNTDCALVGHLPNLGLLLGSLVFGIPAKEVVLAKGGIAHLIISDMELGSAKLRWILTPDSVI